MGATNAGANEGRGLAVVVMMMTVMVLLKKARNSQPPHSMILVAMVAGALKLLPRHGLDLQAGPWWKPTQAGQHQHGGPLFQFWVVPEHFLSA